MKTSYFCGMKIVFFTCFLGTILKNNYMNMENELT